MGFLYVEVVLAVLVLGLCVVPAMEAVRNAVAAPNIVQDRAQALLCVKSQMETVLAEPYVNLNACGPVIAPSLAKLLTQDSACPVNVTIDCYDPNTAPPSVVLKDSGLLHVTVSSPDLSVSFTTLVTP